MNDGAEVHSMPWILVQKFTTCSVSMPDNCPWCPCPGVRALVSVPWCPCPGVRALVSGPWCPGPGVRALVSGPWCPGPGVRALVSGPWCPGPGVQALVSGPWCPGPGVRAWRLGLVSLPEVEFMNVFSCLRVDSRSLRSTLS
jgi:hypothetical protein